jgi:carboxyl-terminal processing protease
MKGALKLKMSPGLWSLLFFVVMTVSCNNDEPVGKNAYVNEWILENMELYYLWNTDIPGSPNKSQEPDVFFESLLSNEDRFSWIQENYQELLNSLQGVNKEAGYEFLLYRDNTIPENVLAQVVYVKAGSPAASTDLKRGDIITQINGQQITMTNYTGLLAQISENHTVKYSRYNFSTTLFEDKGTLSLTTTEFAENPNYLHRVFEIGGKKIGYYVYNFFATGPTPTSTQYKDEMDAIFNQFKAQGITDLIVDLRYNSGGSEGATINLASLVGKGVTSADIFTIREYNDILEAELEQDVRVTKFMDKPQNVGSMLSNSRLYILTRNRTASASELLINGLRPYMDVFIVGDTTVGKNVGSISLYKPNDPRNTWGMQPIIVKSYNKLSQSEYGNGFIPNIANDDNSLVLLPLGDTEENLLSLAITEITGIGSRKSPESRKTLGEIGSSADRKRGNFNLLIDDDRIKARLRPTQQLP